MASKLPERFRTVIEANGGSVPTSVVDMLEVDPGFPLCPFFFCQSVSFAFMLPCFLPHVVVCSPFLCLSALNQSQAAVKSAFVLTEDEVLWVKQEHSSICCTTPSAVWRAALAQTDEPSVQEVKIFPCVCFKTNQFRVSALGAASTLTGVRSENAEGFAAALTKQKDRALGLGKDAGIVKVSDVPIQELMKMAGIAG